MGVTTTRLIRCDHVHESDGKQCLVERQAERIDYKEPMYHVAIVISVIDANGATCLVNEDVYLCYWDLYYHLSGYHDQAKIDIDARKQLQATEQVMDEHDLVIDRLLGPA